MLKPGEMGIDFQYMYFYCKYPSQPCMYNHVHALLSLPLIILLYVLYIDCDAWRLGSHCSLSPIQLPVNNT